MKARVWQSECNPILHAAFAERRDALVSATPGSGKTFLALNFAGELRQSGQIDHIHVAAPTLLITKGWRDVAAGLGITLVSDGNNHLGATDDIVATYAQIGKSPETHAEIISASRTLAVCDEIHHASDDMNWGQSLETALEHARFRLHMSGTPFREDQHRIPFIEYGTDGISKADYTYGYTRAITEGVCRPVDFHCYDAAIRLRGATGDDEIARVMRLTLMPKAGVVEKMVSDADADLVERRKTCRDAAGMVVAMTQAHARDCARIVKEVTGTAPPVIISDSETAEHDLAQFRQGTARWVVAVKMLSEGVDVPRLTTAVYATNIVTTLFFRQLVGRVVRVRDGSPDETASVYMPRDDRLIREAADIEGEISAALALAPERYSGLRRKLAAGTVLITNAPVPRRPDPIDADGYSVSQSGFRYKETFRPSYR